MQKEWEDLLRQILQNKGKIMGTLFGLFIGWLTIKYGLGKALVVALSVIAGYWVGSRMDEEGRHPNLRDLMDRFSGPEE